MGVPEPTTITKPRSADLIPGYRLERLVGRGGMGEVHRAVQLSLGRTVAVKLLANDLAKDPSFVTRFEKEGTALATLSHPHIVAIVDKGQADNTYYLVMEYVDGPSMREVMRSPLLDPTYSLKMVIELCRAIDYAHNRGVIHRDLKPENILFDEQAGGIPKVTDFGLAGFLDDGTQAGRFNLTQTHVSMGTFAYMAPEQRLDARSADHRADIYSLGVILYELLVGEVPAGSFDPPSLRKPQLDKRLDPIVSKCLKATPGDRYQKVSDLLSDLEPLAPIPFTQPPTRLSPVARTRAVATSALRTGMKVGVALLVTAALVVLGAAYWRSRSRPARASPGLELATQEGESWPLTSPGRIDPPQERRRLGLGEGPDTVSVVASGRKPTVQDGAVTFPAPDGETPAGRAMLDADLEGAGLTFSVQVEVSDPESPFLTALRSLFTGPPPPSRAALLLNGDPGRYVALVVSAGDAPPELEWALGSERRGTMSSPSGGLKGSTRLELSIEPKAGELTAYLGEGQDRRMVGEPLTLGPAWRRLFGEMPKAAVGCLDGACRFTAIALLVERELPPPPPPPPPPVEPPPVVAKPPVKVKRPPQVKPPPTRPSKPSTGLPVKKQPVNSKKK